MSAETAAREAICRLGQSLFARGLTFGSAGNISQRLEDGWLMTPTNVAMGDLDPARLSKLDRNLALVSGDPPTKESFLHRVMYDGRPDAGAVVHLHSTHSVAVSCLADIDPDDVLPPITAYYVMRLAVCHWSPTSRPATRVWPRRSARSSASTTPSCSPTTARSSPARRCPRPPARSRNSKRRRGCFCCCRATEPARSPPSKSTSCAPASARPPASRP